MPLTFTIDQDAITLVMESGLGRPLGTGFSFIKPSWIATAKHVVLFNGLPRQDLGVAALGKPAIKGRVLFAHPQVDLAVLETESAVCMRPLFPSHHSLAGAGGLVCAGYAPSKTAEHGAYVVFVNEIPRFDVELRERDGLNEDLVVFDAEFSEGGHSGGPIFGSGGGVVGAIVESFRQESRLLARGTSLLPIVHYLGFPHERA